MSEQHASFQSGVNLNSLGPANLRQRPLGRSTTFTEPSQSSFNRRNSAISDSVSEARQSIRDSTDELLFPRAGPATNVHFEMHNHDSHWQSAPLALALLPAVGGLFFKNGSAVVTDATLLVLAAVFLNWSVRLPWEWYRSAQEIHQPLQDTLRSSDGTILEEDEEEEVEKDADIGDAEKEHAENKPRNTPSRRKNLDEPGYAAIRELHIHELAALISCFVFPMIGAWLLHGIRGALSRPSEGLVSNYNLTIFLLAAEIRPFAHLLRMVQGRTLHLQRVVAAVMDEDAADRKFDHHKILDLAARLEELEAHVADEAVTSSPSGSNLASNHTAADAIKPELLAHLTNEVRQTLQPDLDALNRAVRRYEKKTALMAFQIDTRLSQIEAQVGDAIALAAAAQRSATDRSHSFSFILFDWMAALVVVPMRVSMQLVSLPGRIITYFFNGASNIYGDAKGKRKRRPVKGKQTEKLPLMSEKRHQGLSSSSSRSAVTSGIQPLK